MSKYLFIRHFAGHLLVVAFLTAVALANAGGRHTAAILLAVAVAVTLSALLSAIEARRVSRHVQDVNTAFQRVSEGDFDARVLPARRGDLKELGDGFNETAFRVKTLVAELSHQREALNAVISSMQEGLLVIDGQGQVVLANDAMRRIMPDAIREGAFYWELVRDPALGGLVRSTTAAARADASEFAPTEEHPAPDARAGRLVEFELGGREFAASAVYLPNADRFVLTLHDITELNRAASVKRDIVASVSHELRTPLTAIKGYAETLAETVKGEDLRYVEAIQRHTDRLVNMVDDLLRLSELEQKGLALSFESVDLVAMATSVVKLFDKRAADKSITLELQAAPDVPPVKGDRFKLEQLFINLLDNAVKYTDKGSIWLSISSENGLVHIRFRDTGIGIAPEHLPRLFERFYVVDKSRSRESGGTGLGLSIVRHIALLHGGDVSVQSTPGAGSTFTVTLPPASAS